VTVTSPAEVDVVVEARSPRRGMSRLRDSGPLLALVVIVVVFSVWSSEFRTLGNLKNVMDTASVVTVVACGITFVLLTGSIDLSAPGVMGASALAVSLLVANSRNGHDLGLLGVLIAVGLGAALGCLSGLALTVLKVPSFMTTLGVSAIGLGLGILMSKTEPPVIHSDLLEGLALDRLLGFTHLTWLAAACVLVGWLIQRYTRLGRYAYAIGGAEEVLALSGVKVGPYKVAVFTLAGAFYGLAGVMATSQLGRGLVTEAGAGKDFAAITAAVVGGTLLTGGRGGVLHSVVGVLIVTVLTNGMVLIGVSPDWQRGVQGLIVVVAVAAAVAPLRHRNQVTK
jgi:ribose transport system permease protein